MRQFLILNILLAACAAADAHTLAGDESMASQLGHQLLGLHHLPLSALLLTGGILLLRIACRSLRSGEKRMR